VYGWYSDNSVFLEDPGVYLRPGVYSVVVLEESRPRGSSRTNFQVLVLVLVLVLESQVFDNNTGLAICVRSVSDPKHERWLVQEIRPRPVSSACTKTCSGLQYKLGTMDIGLPRAHDSPQYIVDCCTLVSDVSRQRLRSTSRHQLVGRTYQCRPSLQRAQTRHSP